MTERSPLTQTAVALILGVVLVVICYFFVDRPVAWFVHDHGSWMHGLLRWPPLISDWLKDGALPAMIVVVLWWAWKPAAVCRRCSWRFGQRDCDHGPQTTAEMGLRPLLARNVDQRQSLLDQPRRLWLLSLSRRRRVRVFSLRSCGGDLLRAVDPLAQLFAMEMAVIVLIGGSVCVALVGMNYHFVSDVIAGAMLGSITGMCMTRLFGLSGTAAQS